MLTKFEKSKHPRHHSAAKHMRPAVSRVDQVLLEDRRPPSDARRPRSKITKLTERPVRNGANGLAGWDSPGGTPSHTTIRCDEASTRKER